MAAGDAKSASLKADDVDSMEVWRTDRDSNPGYLAVYTLSKRAPSATRPSVRACAGQPFDSTTW